jgi:polysaccharide biosynthesis transport protein
MHETTTLKRNPGGARDFLAVLFRRRWVIGSVFAVTTLTVLAINLSQPLFYESTGKVILKRGMRDNLIQPGMRTMSWEEELASEVETVESGAVVAEAQKLMDTQRKAAGKRRVKIAPDRVDASVMGESNVIAMSYQDRNPDVALEVTDAMIRAYMAYRRNEYTLQFPKEFFDTEVARVNAELQDWTRRKEAYMAATGTINLQVEGASDKNFVSQQESELASIERDLAQRRQALADMRAQTSETPGAVSSMNDPVISGLKQNLGEARVRYREMETIYVPQSRELAQMKTQIEEMEAQLVTEVGGRVRLAEADVRALEAKASQVRQSLGAGRSRLATYPARTARMSEIELRIASLTKNYEDLTRASAQAKISKATSPDWTVDLLTPAGRPYPKNQRDYVRLALAPIFSLIVGLGLAFFIDGLDATLKSPRETEEALELPVLASLTEHKERRA